jgi:hypothetical protein
MSRARACANTADLIRNDPFLRLAHVHDTFLKDFAVCAEKFMRLFVALGGTASMQQHQRAIGTAPDLTEQVPHTRALRACRHRDEPPHTHTCTNIHMQADGRTVD